MLVLKAFDSKACVVCRPMVNSKMLRYNIIGMTTAEPFSVLSKSKINCQSTRKPIEPIRLTNYRQIYFQFIIAYSSVKKQQNSCASFRSTTPALLGLRATLNIPWQPKHLQWNMLTKPLKFYKKCCTENGFLRSCKIYLVDMLE